MLKSVLCDWFMCYVIYAILSQFMDFVYSLMNECVNQFTAIQKDKLKSKSLAYCVWFIYALREAVTNCSIEYPCMLTLARRHEQR